MTIEELPVWATLPAALLLIVGGLLTAIGSLGLLRLAPFYARMHAPTLGTTLGTGCVLVASMLISSALAHRPVLHEILITVLIVTTSPMTAMLLMRAAVSRSTRSGELQSAPSETDLRGE
jgi:multicomponent K+:H+ antiporter subunit G